ncbi:MAG TPA: site-2 protease family protein [Nitriliruptorales bacterium]
MFPRAVRIATIGGIDVRVDPSWIVIALLVVWSFTRRFQVSYGHPLALALALSVLAATLFFASVLVHELAHALEAEHRDITVGGITLFLFGGVTETHVEAQRPRDEFIMAAVGPYASLVAAALFGLLATAAGYYGGTLPGALADVFGVLGWINLGLAIFNLIPGAPLDGGRVLRSGLWALLKDRDRASRWAARAGQVVASLLLVTGAYQVLAVEGALVNGLWFTLIGWFMFQAASAEIAQTELRGLLRGRTVRALLGPDPVWIPEHRTLAMVVDLLAADTAHRVFPVVDEDGEEVLGALNLDDVRDVEPFDRAFRTAGDLMRPLASLPAIEVDAPLEALLELQRETAIVRVMHGPELWALLTRTEIARAMLRLRDLESGSRRRIGVMRRRSDER